MTLSRFQRQSKGALYDQEQGEVVKVLSKKFKVRLFKLQEEKDFPFEKVVLVKKKALEAAPPAVDSKAEVSSASSAPSTAPGQPRRTSLETLFAEVAADS